MIKLTVKDEEVVAFFSRAPTRQKEAVRAAMRHIASRLYEEVENLLHGGMLQSRSGKLANAQYKEVEEGGNSIRVRVGFDEDEVPYGRVILEGVPHSWDISAHAAHALRFEIQGEPVFAKRVTHPPAPPRNFLAAALAIVQPEIGPAMKEAVSGV